MNEETNNVSIEKATDYLKCPRCGDESEVTEGAGKYRWFIRCMSAECDLESPIRTSEKEALEWWAKPFNAATAQRDEVAGLEEAIEARDWDLVEKAMTAYSKLIERTEALREDK